MPFTMVKPGMSATAASCGRTLDSGALGALGGKGFADEIHLCRRRSELKGGCRPLGA